MTSIRVMFPLPDPLLALSGLAVGLIVGLTGVGGGSLMTPLLVLGFGVAPPTAVGTDLLYAAATKSGGAWFHHRLGHVDWRIVAALAAGSVPTAALTLLALSILDARGAHAAGVMSVALGIALVVTALTLVFRAQLVAAAHRRSTTTEVSPRRQAVATTLVGALVGALVTASSVGAGALGVAALTWMYPGLTARRIVAADIAHAVPLTLVAGLGHWWLGHVDGTLLASLLAGSLPGIALGSQLAARVPERALRALLASVLLLAGGRMIFS